MKTVSKLRKKELKHLRDASYLNASFAFTFTCAPFLVSTKWLQPHESTQKENYLSQ